MTFRNCFCNILRENIQYNVVFFLLGQQLCRTIYLSIGCFYVNTFSCFRKIDRAQAYEESHCSNDLKIKNCLKAHAAHLLQIGMCRNTNNECRKQQWRNDRFNKTQKDVAENVQLLCNVWKCKPDLRPEKHTDHNPGSERFPFHGKIKQ